MAPKLPPVRGAKKNSEIDALIGWHARRPGDELDTEGDDRPPEEVAGDPRAGDPGLPYPEGHPGNKSQSFHTLRPPPKMQPHHVASMALIALANQLSAKAKDSK